MKLSHVFFAGFMLASLDSYAQVFPDILSESLDEKQHQIPQEFKGKYTVLGLMFNQDGVDDLESWLGPFYSQFIDSTGLGSLVYDVNTGLMVCLSNTQSSLKNRVKEEISKNTDYDFYSYVHVCVADFKELQNQLKLKGSKKELYIVVLNEAGEMIHYEKGAHTSAKFDRISQLVEL